MRLRSIVPLLCATAAVAPAAASAVSWSAPQVLSATGRAELAYASTAADGTTRALWAELGSIPHIETATRAPGAASFGPAQTFLGLSSFEDSGAAGLDGNGRAIVVLRRHHAPYSRIRAVIQRADGTMPAAVTISPKGHSVTSVATLAVDPAGDAIAAWNWYDGHGSVPQIAIRRAGGRFGAPITVGADEVHHGSSPIVAIATGGRFAVAYEIAGKVFAVTGDLASEAVQPQLLGTYRPSYAPMDVAIGATGRAVVDWIDVHYASSKGGPTQLHAAIAEPGAAFGPATTLGDVVDSDGEPPAAVTTDGTALLAYVTTAGLVTVAAPADGAFGAPVVAGAVGSSGTFPSLATRPAGGAALTWTLTSPGATSSAQIHSVAMIREYAPGTGFGPAVALSPADQEALDPVAALGATGATVIWIRSLNGEGEGDVEAATRG